MFSKPTNGAPAVPSRNVLRVLRNLAFAGSTVGAFCAVAAVTYDVHLRVRMAERIIANKRALHSSAPNYDATSSARRLARMMEKAELGEFMGIASLNDENANSQTSRSLSLEGAPPNGQGTEKRQSPAKPPGPACAGSLPKGIHPPSLLEPPQPSSAQLADPLDRIWRLIENGKLVAAAQSFLDTHPAGVQGISSDRRELLVQLFYANCKQGNVFIARTLFNRLEDIDTVPVSATMWKVMMLSFAKAGHIESTAALYVKYMDRFPVPPHMLDIIVRCLIESHRLTTAKWVLLRNLQHDRQCGLAGAYLSGLWKKTRSIELINGQFTKILSSLPRLGKEPTEKLFNPVLRAYVEFGRTEEAEALVEEMRERYQIPLSCRTKGILVFAKALRLEWEAVEEELQEMCDLGMNQEKYHFAKIIDRVFLEYYITHSGTAARDFIMRCVNDYGVVPDQVLYNHVVEAFIEKGNAEMVAEWSKLARERSWKVSIDDENFLEMIRIKRLRLENSPVGFWQMARAAQVKYEHVAVSQQVLGYDQQSFPLAEVNVMPGSHEIMPWYDRTLQDMSSSKSVDQYQPLDKQMVHYINSGRMPDALKCFENAKNAKLHLKTRHIVLAVIATLLHHGLAAARAMIEVEWKGIESLTTVFPIFFRQVTEIEPEAESELVKLAVFQYYNLCWENPKLLVKHHLTVATSHRLIMDGKPHVALDLLRSVYKSRYGRILKFDGTCIKMFVRVFADLDHLKGLRWCLLTALSRGSALNVQLVAECRRALSTLTPEGRMESKAMNSQAKKRMRIRRARHLEYLNYLTDMLERKSQGEPGLWQLKFNKRLKRAARAKLYKQKPSDRSLFHRLSIQEDVKNWDEEYELELLFEEPTVKPHLLRILWDEERVTEGNFALALDEEEALYFDQQKALGTN